MAVVCIHIQYNPPGPLDKATRTLAAHAIPAVKSFPAVTAESCQRRLCDWLIKDQYA
jgi:hypothetical protein